MIDEGLQCFKTEMFALHFELFKRRSDLYQKLTQMEEA